MNQVFPITPASGGIYWALGPILVLLAGVIALLGYLSYSATHVRFETSPEGLRIRGDLYGRFVPVASLRLSEAKEINLQWDTEHRPAMRTNGAALPGYRSGWFRLVNREKALVFVTDTSHVIYLPTREGYSLLLSPADSQAFMASIQSMSSR